MAKTQKAADWSQLLLVLMVLGVPRAVESYQQKNTAAPPPGPAVQPAARAPSSPASAGAGPLPAPFTPQTPSQLDPGAMMGAANTVQ